MSMNILKLTEQVNKKVIFDNKQYNISFPYNINAICDIVPKWCATDELKNNVVDRFKESGSFYIFTNKTSEESFILGDEDRVPMIRSGNYRMMRVGDKGVSYPFINHKKYFSKSKELIDILNLEYNLKERIQYSMPFSEEEITKWTKTNDFAKAVYRIMEGNDMPFTLLEPFLGENDFIGDYGDPKEDDMIIDVYDWGLRLKIAEAHYKEKFLTIHEDDEWAWNMAMGHYGYSDCEEMDDEELNYMQNYLSPENLTRLDELTKNMGTNMNEWEDEGGLADFFEEKFNSIWNNWYYNWLNALGCAITRERVKALKQYITSEILYPFTEYHEYFSMKLTYPQLLQLIGTHNIKTFGELADYDINEIGENLQDLYYDAWEVDDDGIYEMNNDFKNLLDRIKDEYPDLQKVKQNIDKFKETTTNLGFDRRGSYGRDSGIYLSKKEKIEKGITVQEQQIEISDYDPETDTMKVRDLTGKDSWSQRNQVEVMTMTTEQLVEYMHNYQIDFPEDDVENLEESTGDKKTIILKEDELIELMSSTLRSILVEQDKQTYLDKMYRLGNYNHLSPGKSGVVNGVSVMIWNKGTKHEEAEWYDDYEKRLLKWRHSETFKNKYGNLCNITPKNWSGIHDYILDNELEHYINDPKGGEMMNQNKNLLDRGNTYHKNPCTYIRALGLSSSKCADYGEDYSKRWHDLDWILMNEKKPKSGVKYNPGQNFDNISPTLAVDLIYVIEKVCLNRKAVETMGSPDDPASVPHADYFLPQTNKPPNQGTKITIPGLGIFNTVDDFVENMIETLQPSAGGLFFAKMDWLTPIFKALDSEYVHKTIQRFVKAIDAGREYYHYIIDAISFIAYLACPFTAGAGCLVSVGADVLNAILYIYDDGDYYMAGMQMAFALVPGGEFLTYGAKWAKPFVNPILRAGYQGVKGPAIKELAKKQMAKMSMTQKLAIRQVFSKETIKTMKSQWKAVDGIMRPYFKKVWGFKPLWTAVGGLMRALFIFVDMVWYDPEFTGNLLKVVGKWAGIEKLETWGEAMQDWTKYGVNVANMFYTNNPFNIGDIKALVQTEIADCNNTVYTWEWAIKDYMTERNIEEDDFDEEEFEKDWWQGWRPQPMTEGGRSGERESGFETVNPDNISLQTQKEMDEMSEKHEVWTNYVAMHACTNEEFKDKYGIHNMSCAQFEVYIDDLKHKTEFVSLDEGVGMELSAVTVLFITFTNLCLIN